MITAVSRCKLWRLKTLFLGLCALAGALLVCWRAAPGVVPAGTTPLRPAPYIETYAGSRNLSDYLYPGQESLMEPYAHRCSRESDHQVVVLVASAPPYALRRALARETWAKSVPTFFFLGRSSEQELRMNDELVNSYVESKRHNDVIVGDYLDSYQNLTIKTVHMLGWAVHNCPGAKYFLKMDDDALLNPWRLRMMLERVNPSGGELMGYRHDGARPDRDVSSKTYLPGWLFRNEEFPPYLSGAGYLISAKHIRSVYETAFKIPLLHLEDLFITGIVAGQTLGLQLTHSARFSYTYWFSESGCLHWNMVIVHRLTPSGMLRIWNKVRQLGMNHDRGGRNFFCRIYEYVFFNSID